MFDVAVIGAGIVGALIARRLTAKNMKVCVLERGSDVALGATGANSAIVHAGFDAACGSLKARLNVRGAAMMEELCRTLGVKYQKNGSLVVGFDSEDEKTLRELLLRGEKNGVRDLRILSADEVRAIEPNVGDGVRVALHAPTGAIISPYELCIAAVGNAIDNGAALLRNFEVVRIEKKGGVYEISSESSSVQAMYVINSAGAHADEIARMVGDASFTVRPRRGEYILLDRDCGSHITHTVFRCPTKMGKGTLVTPTVDGNLLIGPTAENIDDKSDTKTTVDGMNFVRSKAKEQVRGINFGKSITTFSGLRAAASTGDFIINSPKENFINVAGIESPGLSASPAIAEYVENMLLDMGAKMSDKEDFISERRPAHYFRELNTEQKNEIIREHPEYAHIICRCERVSEGEIIEAIRAEPRPTDVDGVKRRTRATMGRCQGGFCLPYIVELLARELGCDTVEITKRGGSSYINLGNTKEYRLKRSREDGRENER